MRTPTNSEVMALAVSPVPSDQVINQTSKPGLLQQALQDRKTMDAESLGVLVEQCVGVSLFTLKMSLPLVEELKRRFRILDRKRQVNGQYLTIRGCRTFQEFCTTVLKRTEQAVYKALRSGQPKKALPSHEPQQDESAAKFLPRLETIFGKDQVRITPSCESKFKVTFLIEEKDLDIFLEKASQPAALLPAGTKKKRLTAEDRKSICEQVRLGKETQAAIAARYGVTQATVSNIWRGTELNGAS